MKNKKIIGITAFSIVMGTAVVSANASSDWSFGVRNKHVAVSSEVRQNIDNALENKDYSAWKGIIEESGNAEILDVINESNFAEYCEAYELRKSGDMDGYKEAMEALGVKDCGLCHGRDGKMTHGDSVAMNSDEYDTYHSALYEAFENEDYEAWKALVGERGNSKVLEIINEDNFAEFAQAKILQEEGDVDAAKEILDGLGFPFKERRVREFSKASVSE